MKILIISICVNYADYLEFCYLKNKPLIDNHYYVIVTDSQDTATINFCKTNNIKYFITDEFYTNGKPFNRARAINTLFQSGVITYNDFEYILFLDADCIINNITDNRGNSPIDIFMSLEDKDEKCLYGCARRVFNTLNNYYSKYYTHINCNFIGFFQLFHKSNLFYNGRLLDEHKNVAVHDVLFADRFHNRYDLGLDVDHIGPIYTNWDGRQSTLWK